MPLRTCKEFNLENPNFIGVSFALLLVYFIYLYEFIIREGQYLIVPWFIITTFFYIMSLWSFVAVSITNPGNVPIYWALYTSDKQERKYCLVCHNFKPQRCHHCSKCGKCILNMDHHCPWINNCVGFNNRKYFVLFLFYIVLTFMLAVGQMALILFNQIKQLISNERHIDIHTILRWMQFLFCIIFLICLIVFLHFHIKIVFANISTLEFMLKEKQKKHAESRGNSSGQINSINENVYNIGPWYNFTQIFGENVFYWFLPIQQQNPLRGKGVQWLKNVDRNNGEVNNRTEFEQKTSNRQCI